MSSIVGLIVGLTVALILGWLLVRCLQRVLHKPGPIEGLGRPALAATYLNYAFDGTRNWALCLAHPMALARVRSGFACAEESWPRDELQQTMRPALLHLFGLRNDLADAQVRTLVCDKLSKGWFCIDLDALRLDDNPRDAMAFACARVAFATRLAGAMGWIDETSQWSVLLQNAQRANDCFTSWRDFGQAWARGRKQWVAHSRADSLGVSFDEARVELWLSDPKHPWSAIPWKVPPLFVPPTFAPSST